MRRLATVCLLLAAATAHADDLAATLSTNAIRIGDPVALTLRVPHAADARITWPELADGRRIAVREHRIEDEAGTSVATWHLTSYETGTHALATNPVRIATASGEQLLSLPSPLTLSVVSALGTNDVAPRPSKPLASWPSRFWVRLLAVLAGVALLAALVAFAVRALIRRARRPTPPPPPVPPHERALRELETLRAKGWMERGEAEPFYVALSDIVRRYLEGRFALRAPELTTEEFIREAAVHTALQDAHRKLVSDFLVQSDLVKFARHRPERAAMEDGHASAVRLVRETTPAAPAP